MTNSNVLICYSPLLWNKGEFPSELEELEFQANKHYDKEEIFGQFDTVLLLDKHVDVNRSQYRKYINVKMRFICHVRIFLCRISIKKATLDDNQPNLTFLQLELESQDIVDFTNTFQRFQIDRKVYIEFIVELLKNESDFNKKDVLLDILSLSNFSTPIIYLNLLFYEFQGNLLDIIKLYKIGKTIVDDYQQIIISDRQGSFALIINLLKTSGSAKNIRNISMRFFLLRFFSWYNIFPEKLENDEMLKMFIGFYQYLLYGSGNADIYRKIAKIPYYQIRIFEKIAIFDLLNQTQLVSFEPEFKLAQLDKIFQGHIPANEIVMKFAFMTANVFTKNGKLMDELCKKNWYVIYSPKENMISYHGQPRDHLIVRNGRGLRTCSAIS